MRRGYIEGSERLKGEREGRRREEERFYMGECGRWVGRVIWRYDVSMTTDQITAHHVINPL